jgi:hypothetical protein
VGWCWWVSILSTIILVPTAIIIGLNLGIVYEKQERELVQGLEILQEKCANSITTYRAFTKRWGTPVQCTITNDSLCPGHPSVKLKQRYNITKWDLTWDHNNTIVVLWKSVTSNTLQGYIVNITKGPVLVN